jgi:hypothetical protein
VAAALKDVNPDEGIARLAREMNEDVSAQNHTEYFDHELVAAKSNEIRTLIHTLSTSNTKDDLQRLIDTRLNNPQEQLDVCDFEDSDSSSKVDVCVGDDDDGGVQADTTLTTALLNAASKAPPTVSEECKNAILRSLLKKPKKQYLTETCGTFLYFYIYGLF